MSELILVEITWLLNLDHLHFMECWKGGLQATFWQQQSQVNRNNIALKRIHSFSFGFALANFVSCSTTWKLGFSLLERCNASFYLWLFVTPTFPIPVTFLTWVFVFLTPKHLMDLVKSSVMKKHLVVLSPDGRFARLFERVSSLNSYPDITPTLAQMPQISLFSGTEGTDGETSLASEAWGRC